MTASDSRPPNRRPDSLLSLGAKPQTAWLVIAVFVLILGIPAGLFAYRGRLDVAFGMIALFLAMVLTTAYALRKAVTAHREAKEAINADNDNTDP